MPTTLRNSRTSWQTDHWGFLRPPFCSIITELRQTHMALSSDYIRTSLQALYGNNITSADIRAWCNMNDANYQTVTKKIDGFKTPPEVETEDNLEPMTKTSPFKSEISLLELSFLGSKATFKLSRTI